MSEIRTLGSSDSPEPGETFIDRTSGLTLCYIKDGMCGECVFWDDEEGCNDSPSCVSADELISGSFKRVKRVKRVG